VIAAHRRASIGPHGEFAPYLDEGELELFGDLASGGWWWSLPSTRRWRLGRGGTRDVDPEGWCGEAVGGDAVEGDGAIGALQGDPPSGVQLHGPAALVNEVVMELANGDEIVEIGPSQASRRITSTGNGCPSAVSATVTTSPPRSSAR